MNKPPATIRTRLLRGAFLLSLLGVIVIPFALGQQDASKGNVTKPAAKQNVAANTYRTGPPVTEMFSAHSQQPNISRTELSHLITADERRDGRSLGSDSVSAEISAGRSLRSVQQWFDHRQLVCYVY